MRNPNQPFSSTLSAHVEFTKVTPYLQEGYSPLLVDLPEHSASNDISFSIPTAADQLQQLIHDQVPNHRVHVVGVSLGGCFGLGLARQHPHRMKSLFATGSVPYRGVRRFIAEHPQLLYCIIVIQFLLMRILPAWVRKYFEQLKDYAELLPQLRSNMTFHLLQCRVNQSRGIGCRVSWQQE